MTLYIKKVFSLNPKMFKHITLKEAIEEYSLYVVECFKQMTDAKDFEKWLNSEI